jgi:hypothetical protein
MIPHDTCAVRTNMGGRCQRFATFRVAVKPIHGGEGRILPCCGTHYAILRRGCSLGLADPPGEHRLWEKEKTDESGR